MKISEKITQEKFLEILRETYTKGHAEEKIELQVLVEEIKRQLLNEIKAHG